MKAQFYRIMVIAVLAIAFVSCEKLSDNKQDYSNENSVSETTQNSNNYVFVNPTEQHLTCDTNSQDEKNCNIRPVYNDDGTRVTGIRLEIKI
ncbi:MAG: hypothetical protein LBV69_02085 [Bacteroidales bacterium]|jgi:hypothetical protein|nr:hypothetical protein [Bacteroidales bacterium]